MSSPDSTQGPADSGGKTLWQRAQESFFIRDHVGVVRHYEGNDIKDLIAPIRDMLSSRGAKFEDEIGQIQGRVVYTNVATFQSGRALTLWLTATEIQGVGTVLDAKLFHETEQSAEADEQLSLLVEELQQRIFGPS